MFLNMVMVKLRKSSMASIDVLIGSWRLLSAAVTMSDTKERIEAFGPTPVGKMILSANGRIMVLFTPANRQRPETEADKAKLFDFMTAYTGRVRVDGSDRFVTTIDLASNPGFEGEQVRYFTLDGNRLTLRTPEQTDPLHGDRLFIDDFVWIREE